MEKGYANSGKIRKKVGSNCACISRGWVSIVSEKRAFSHLPTPSLGRDAIFLLLWAESKELALSSPSFLYHPSRSYSSLFFWSTNFQRRVEKKKLAKRWKEEFQSFIKICLSRWNVVEGEKKKKEFLINLANQARSNVSFSLIHERNVKMLYVVGMAGVLGRNARAAAKDWHRLRSCVGRKSWSII